MLLSLLVPFAILPFSLAAKHSVQVGNRNGDNVFVPTNVTAAVKDTIEFTFYPRNHSVAESDFSSPCKAKTGGIFSGFIPVQQGTASEIFTVTVNDTNPRWIYCSQITHCTSDGMVFVINPPSQGGNTLSAYQAAAQKLSTSDVSSQPEVAGGVVSNTTSSSSSSSSAASSATSSSTGTATAGSSRSSSGTSTATGTAASATHTGAAGKAGAGAGLGALGLLSFLVGGMI